MTLRRKPVIHYRDHEHGGADVVKTVYEKVGSDTISNDDLPAPVITGIQFDTYPQLGNFLYADVDGPSGIPDGYGIELNDRSGGGALLTSGFAGGATGRILLAAGASSADGATIILRADSSGGQEQEYHLVSDDPDAFFTVPGHYFTLRQASGVAYFEVRNGLTAQPLLRIGSDGSFHIKTGASWVADL